MISFDGDKPSIRSLALALEVATGPDPQIDADLCRFFFWAGSAHGQADIQKPFEVVGGEAPLLSFARKYDEGDGLAPIPNVTGSVEEAAALVRAFAPHLEWTLTGWTAWAAQSDDRPYATLAPDAEHPDPGTGAVSKYGATHSIALLHALLHVLGRDGMVLEAGDDVTAVGRAAYRLRQVAWRSVKDGLEAIHGLSDCELAHLRARVDADIAGVGPGMCETDFQAAIVDIEERDRARYVASDGVPF